MPQDFRASQCFRRMNHAAIERGIGFIASLLDSQHIIDFISTGKKSGSWEADRFNHRAVYESAGVKLRQPVEDMLSKVSQLGDCAYEPVSILDPVTIVQVVTPVNVLTIGGHDQRIENPAIHRLRSPHQRLQSIGFRDGVIIHQPNPVIAEMIGQINAFVEPARRAARLRHGDASNLWKLGSKHLRRAVRTAVVNDDDRIERTGLTDEAV